MHSIFIVDDHPVIRLAVRMLLENQNYKIVGESDNGVDAMQMIREAAPDLVILDISIPKLDGLEALKALRALESRHQVPAGQEAKVVMVSSCDDTGSVCDAYFHGLADGYVKKPVRMTSFWDELKRLGLFIPETHSHTG